MVKLARRVQGLECVRDVEAIIPPAGAVVFAVAKPLREFTEAGLAAGCRKFLIDLGNAASCDSTFLGVLAGLAAQTGGEGWIQLVNANAQTTKVMQDTGITRMMRLRSDPVELPDLPLQRLEPELGTP